MPLNIQSNAQVNSLFWIKSLKENEEGSTRRVLDDLEPLLASLSVPFEVVTPKSSAEFIAALVEIERLAKAGAKPMIHIDTHGNRDTGIHIVDSNESVGWDVLAHHTREINIATENNLCVISAACSGFHAVKQNTIHKAAPFYILVGPAEPISFGFTEGSIFPFYRHVFQNLNIVEAYEKYLKPQMHIFHSEELFVVGMARYFRLGCMGKAAKRRVDYLVGEAIKNGASNDPANLKRIRSIARDKIKPSADIFRRFASSYLVGKNPGVTYEQIMELVRKHG